MVTICHPALPLLALCQFRPQPAHFQAWQEHSAWPALPSTSLALHVAVQGHERAWALSAQKVLKFDQSGNAFWSSLQALTHSRTGISHHNFLMQDNTSPAGIRPFLPPHSASYHPDPLGVLIPSMGNMCPFRTQGGWAVHPRSNLALLCCQSKQLLFHAATVRHQPTVSPKLHKLHIQLSNHYQKAPVLEREHAKKGEGRLEETPSTLTTWFKNTFPIYNNSVQKLF